MPTRQVRQPVLERNRSLREREKSSKNPLSKHLLRVYPLGIQKMITSSLTLSSLSFNLSPKDSALHGCIGHYWDRNLPAPSLPQINGAWEKKKNVVAAKDEGLKRCHWITQGSDAAYVSFHDERWGVPVFEDRQLFELLTLSGMLIDQNWTEILSKRELYREAFAEFEANIVAKMEEKAIIQISSNKKLMLAESRVRCIVENAKCITKIVVEYGSFSRYLWGNLSFKPIINKHRYPKSVPLRTPKAEAISRDLIRRGFRLVGPVITYSFMQAAGMAMDHLLHCFRFNYCFALAQNKHPFTPISR